MKPENIMIMNDLKIAGFNACEKTERVFVSLNSRPISQAEVSLALEDNGYDIGQFWSQSYHGAVIVDAVVG